MMSVEALKAKIDSLMKDETDADKAQALAVAQAWMSADEVTRACWFGKAFVRNLMLGEVVVILKRDLEMTAKSVSDIGLALDFRIRGLEQAAYGAGVVVEPPTGGKPH